MTLVIQPVIQRTKCKNFDFFRSSYYSLVPAPPADLFALQMNLTYIWLGNGQIVKIIKCSRKGPADGRKPTRNLLLLAWVFLVNVDFTDPK